MTRHSRRLKKARQSRDESFPEWIVEMFREPIAFVVQATKERRQLIHNGGKP